jgi:predicted secreted protein
MYMKKLFVICSLVLASLAARADYVATVVNVSRDIKEVDLDDEGLVRIYLHDGGSKEKVVAKSTMARLSKMVAVLSKATIVTTQPRAVRCMMATPAWTNHQLSVLSNGEFKVVLANQGCQYSTSTNPKNSMDDKLADKLLATLLTLAESAL